MSFFAILFMGLALAAAPPAPSCGDKLVTVPAKEVAQTLGFAVAKKGDDISMREPMLRVYMLMPTSEREEIFRQLLAAAAKEATPIDVTYNYPPILDLIRRDELARALWEKEIKGKAQYAFLNRALGELGPLPLHRKDIDAILAKKPKTVTAFLAELPPEFRRRYTAMYETGSSQSADAKSPRIIFFNESLVVAFGGDATKHRFDSAEIAYLNPNSARVELYDVTPGKNAHVELSALTPQSCAGCHGGAKDPHANWANYNFWHGAVGSYEDIVGTSKTELDVVANLKTKAKTDPRYKLLVGVDTHFTAEKNIERANNAFLGNVLNLHNLTRVYRLMAASPNYCKFRFAIMAALNECKDLPGFIPETVREGWKSFDEFLRESASIAKKADARMKKVHGEQERNPSDFFETQKVAGLRYLLENRGISMFGWSTDKESGYGWSSGISTAGELKTLIRWSDKDLGGDPDCESLKKQSLDALGVIAPMPREKKKGVAPTHRGE